MKKIILSIVAITMGVSINAQTDCATAQAITVGADDSYVTNASALSGNIPAEVCFGGYELADITMADWYSYTPTQDLVVTVTSETPQGAADYVASFNVFTGPCATLTCVGGSYVTQSGTTLFPAEVSFIALAGETYYIVFDNFYEEEEVGVNAPFNFTLTTDSNIPNAPDVASNPTPADGAIDVEIVMNAQQQPTVAFAWDAATTGDPADAYDFYLSDPTAADPTELNLLGSTAGTAVNITGMEYDETYFWMVVPRNVAGDATGAAIWSFTTEESLSVNDVEQVKFVHFTSNNMLNIQSQVQMNSVVVYNMLGKEVLSDNVSGNNAEVNISQLATGVYIAQLDFEGKLQTFKFVKK